MKTEEQWYERFGEPVDNNGTSLFETYGEELEKVKAADPLTVWTVVETDSENQYLVPGFRLVNRIGYVLSEKPITEDELTSGEWDEILWVDADELGYDADDKPPYTP